MPNHSGAVLSRRKLQCLHQARPWVHDTISCWIGLEASNSVQPNTITRWLNTHRVTSQRRAQWFRNRTIKHHTCSLAGGRCGAAHGPGCSPVRQPQASHQPQHTIHRPQHEGRGQHRGATRGGGMHPAGGNLHPCGLLLAGPACVDAVEELDDSAACPLQDMCRERLTPLPLTFSRLLFLLAWRAPPRAQAPHFVAWMRASASPDLVKPWAVVHQELPAGVRFLLHAASFGLRASSFRPRSPRLQASQCAHPAAPRAASS